MNFRVVQIFNTWCFPYGNDKARIQTVLVREGKPSSFNQTGLHHQDGYVSPLESKTFDSKSLYYHDSRTCYISLKQFAQVSNTKYLNNTTSKATFIMERLIKSHSNFQLEQQCFTRSVHPLPLSARGLNLPPNLQKGVFYIKNKLKSEIFNDKTSL